MSELPPKFPDTATANPRTPDTSRLASDALFAAVYERLKAMAGRQLAHGGPRATLGTTELVHELYLRINTQGHLAFAHPSQFFSYAAHAMRHLLVDRARMRLSQRRGGDWQCITLTSEGDSLALESAEQVTSLDAALSQLHVLDSRAAQIVELRYFAGLTAEQSAQTLGIAKRTADRDWTFAMAFLKAELA